MSNRLLQPIDYVTKDFAGFLALMKAQISTLTPEWTDTSDEDFGIVLLKLLAYGLDILSYYQDKAVQESLLPTAKTRKAVLALCETLGYSLAQQEPAIYKLYFVKQDAFIDQTISVLAGTGVGTNPLFGNQVSFETGDSVIIPAGCYGDERELATVASASGAVLTLADITGFVVDKTVRVKYASTGVISAETNISAIDTNNKTVTLGTDLLVGAGDKLIGRYSEYTSIGIDLFATTATQWKSKSQVLGVGTGEASKSFTLSYASALIDTVQVWTTEYGVVRDWARVDDFLDSTASDRHYTAKVDENNLVTVEFGDGLSGMRLPVGITASCFYKIGGGKAGNVGLNAITDFTGAEVAGIDSMFNPEAPTQTGKEAEDIEYARVMAPKLARANDRCVTVADFESFSCNFENIVKAKAVETFNANGDLNIYIATNEYTPTTALFKSNLWNYLDEKKLITINPIIHDATFKLFDVTVAITTNTNYWNADVKATVENYLTVALHVSQFDFGYTLVRNRLIKEILLLDGVDDLVFTTPTGDTTSLGSELLSLRTLTVNVTGGC